MSKADEFRRHAQECRDWAGKVPSDDQRDMWLELADRWDQLADSLEEPREKAPLRRNRAGLVVAEATMWGLRKPPHRRS